MNVALVEENPVFRTTLRAILNRRFQNLAPLETESMESLEKIMQMGIFDIIIIGFSDEQSEINESALKMAMEKNPFSAFIVYASTPDHKQVRSLIRMGVKGYLPKYACADELVNCVRTVFSGNPYLSPQILVSLHHTTAY